MSVTTRPEEKNHHDRQKNKSADELENHHGNLSVLGLDERGSGLSTNFEHSVVKCTYLLHVHPRHKQANTAPVA